MLMKIAVLGIGAYGIALANVFCENKNEVVMWSKLEAEVKEVLEKRENSKVLPGIKIPEEIKILSDLKEAIDNTDIIVIAVPTKFVREISKDVSIYLDEKQIICLVSKGIEEGTNKLMSEVAYEETKSENICMISGPSFAIELANNVETGFAVASKELKNAEIIKKCVENDKVIVETTEDIMGIQISASAKNVFAILMGMLEGMGKSDSTKAAILTCLVSDLKLIIKAFGGNEKTIFTYASIGDMLLTCMSNKSRNYRFGYNLGKGLSIEETFEAMQLTTIEGLYTLNSLINVLKEKNVEVKSINLLREIIYEGKKIEHMLEHINY